MSTAENLTQNPTQNTVVLRGWLSTAPTTKPLASGATLIRYSVAVPRDDGPTDSVPVTWICGVGEAPPEPAQKDEEVVVVGRVQRRFWKTATGTASSTEVVAQHLLRASDRRRVTSVLKKVCLA